VRGAGCLVRCPVPGASCCAGCCVHRTQHTALGTAPGTTPGTKHPEARQYTAAPPRLSTQHNVNASEEKLHLGSGKFADTLGKHCFVQRYDLGHIGDRVLRQTRRSSSQKYVAWSVRPSQIAGQRHAPHGSDPASVQGVPLDHHDRSSKAWPRSCWRRKVGPPHFALPDYHSVCSRTRRLAAVMKESGWPFTAAHTRSMASVTSSGA
jgi:hypothetical protein